MFAKTPTTASPPTYRPMRTPTRVSRARESGIAVDDYTCDDDDNEHGDGHANETSHAGGQPRAGAGGALRVSRRASFARRASLPIMQDLIIERVGRARCWARVRSQTQNRLRQERLMRARAATEQRMQRFTSFFTSPTRDSVGQFGV